MINAQEWLDKNYLQEKREEIKELYLNEQLNGKLDLSDFSYLSIYISHYVNEAQITFIVQEDNIEIIKLISAQIWLDENYPQDGVCLIETRDERIRGIGGWNNKGKTREQVLKLDVSGKNLTGELNLTGFSNLSELCCRDNYLTNLSSLLINLNPQKLWVLDLSHNNFTGDLTPLGIFNLEQLFIASNSFTGSLAPLRSSGWLRILKIDNTNLTSGLEYLPGSLRKFYCSSCPVIEQLKDSKDYKQSDYFNYFVWKKDHSELIKKTQKAVELKNILDDLTTALTNSHCQSFTISLGLNIFIFEIQSEINDLEKESQKYYQAKIEISPNPNLKK